MISAEEVVVEPAKEAAVLASIVVAAADGGKMAADVDEATNASHMQITLILLTPPEFYSGQVGTPRVYAFVCLTVTRRRSWWPRKKRPELSGEQHE
jgi:hypothetical protein